MMKSTRAGGEVVVVEDLQFDFDDSWLQALKWDDSTAYRSGVGRLRGTKAVDILCRRQGSLWFIEVKDFREYRIENKKKLEDGELMFEVAQKVRDTIAGLAIAMRSHEEPERWRSFAEALVGDDIRVVLWLEEDFHPPLGEGTAEERWRDRLSEMQSLLKQHLRWLTTHVLVASTQTRNLPGLRVSNFSQPSPPPVRRRPRRRRHHRS